MTLTDDLTRIIADGVRLGLSVTTCIACGLDTLYRRSEQLPNPPRTCGMRSCLVACGDPLGVDDA